MAGKKAEVESEGRLVLIGQKPVMRYVVACLTSFSSGAKKVVVKARDRLSAELWTLRSFSDERS